VIAGVRRPWRASSQQSLLPARCAGVQVKSVTFGDPASSPNSLTIAQQRSRRQVATRLLRIREASGLSQTEVGERVGISKRAVGGLERAEHRMTALEAFLFLFDRVVEEQGLDAALAAILPDHFKPAEQSAPAKRAA